MNTETLNPKSACSKTLLADVFKSKFKIGMQFERFPDAENGLILLTITKISKNHLCFGSDCKRHKSWLAKNNFRLVENIR